MNELMQWIIDQPHWLENMIAGFGLLAFAAWGLWILSRGSGSDRASMPVGRGQGDGHLSGTAHGDRYDYGENSPPVEAQAHAGFWDRREQAQPAGWKAETHDNPQVGRWVEAAWEKTGGLDSHAGNGTRERIEVRK